MRVPVFGILYVALFQCAVLVVFWLYDRELPKALTYYSPDSAALIGIALMCLAHGAVLASLTSLIRHVVGYRGFTLAFIISLVPAIVASVDVSYYVAYGSYPGWQLWSNLFYSPRTVLSYAMIASSSSEAAFLLVSLILSACIAVRMWRDVSRNVSWILCFVFAATLLGGGHLALRLSHPRGYRFIAREHSLPVVRWYGGVVQPTGNGLEEIQRILPPAKADSVEATSRSVRNVVVVMIECLRPDHLSVYGYARKTTPNLESAQQDLVLFSRAYAHGPSTETSFPVTFTGRYLPTLNPPSTSVWHRFREAGVRTAFISSGQLKWGYLDRIIDLPAVDTLFTAAQAEMSEKMKFSSDPRDYGIDDRIAFDRYVSFIKSLAPSDVSFSVLHLEATHYPYLEPAQFRKFTPTLGDGDRGRSLGEVRASISDPALRERLLNSYDNSIAFADSHLGELFSQLKAAGRLDDTVVIITADHGEAFGEHDSGFHGTTLYEEQVRVPVMIRVPEALTDIKTKLLKASHAPRGLVDILPTAFELLGVSKDPGFEGISWLQSKAKPYEVLMYSGFGRKVAVIFGNQKFIFDCLTLEAFHFDLDKDPRELTNLWTEDAATLRSFLVNLFP